MKITIKRSFERTRQIADFIPVKAACEVTIERNEEELNRLILEGNKTIEDIVAEFSTRADALCIAEVEKTLAGYTPSCIVCGGKALFPKKVLNKEGVCAQCQSENEMKLREAKSKVGKTQQYD
jgi:hypothetical protein